MKCRLPMMILWLVVFFACDSEKQSSSMLLARTDISAETATYEGRWIVDGGVISLELVLTTKVDPQAGEYRLTETFNSEGFAASAHSSGAYTAFGPLSDGQYQIQLHNVKAFDKLTHFRYRDPGRFDSKLHMFFLTRGQSEFLPCDNRFVPITRDRKYTLHQRSRLFTIEGYIYANADSVAFFERNTREYWRLADLGEFDEVVQLHHQLATDEFEGVYLKALAYSILDTAATHQESLVVKRIIKGGSKTE